MNTRRLLNISLAVNAGLLLLILNLLSGKRTQIPPEPQPLPRPGPMKSINPSIPSAGSETAEGTEWQEYLESLYASDGVESVVTRLALLEFDAEWDDYLHELEEHFAQGNLDEWALYQLKYERDMELERYMRSVLGDTGYRHWDQNQRLRGFNIAALPSEEQRDLLYDATRELTFRQYEIHQAFLRGEIDEAMMNERQRALQQEHDQQLKRQLGEETYAALHAQPDRQEGEFHSALNQLNITAAQYESMLNAEREWQARQAEWTQQVDANGSGEISPEQRQALEEERDLIYQSLLGEEQYAAFRKVQDVRYKTLKQFAEAWRLSDADIEFVYEKLNSTQQMVDRSLALAREMAAEGEAVNWTRYQEELGYFIDEGQKPLWDYLGEERYRQLNRNGIFDIKNTIDP